MKLGISTWCLLKSDVYTAVRTIAEKGYDFVELWGDVPHAYHETVDKGRLKDVVSSYGITTTLHAPFAELNPAMPFQPVKAAVERTLIEFVGFGRFLGSRRITVHPGSVHSEALIPESIDSSVSTLRKLVGEAGDGIEINVENQAASRSPYLYPLGCDAKSIDTLLSRAPGLGLTLDVGHAHANGIDPQELYSRFRHVVTEVHLDDNNGSSDDHLPPGQGTARIGPLTRELGRSDVFVCLELNPHRLSPDQVMAAGDLARRELGPR